MLTPAVFAFFSNPYILVIEFSSGYGASDVTAGERSYWHIAIDYYGSNRRYHAGCPLLTGGGRNSGPY
jgi:hypothetical protein